MNVQPAAERSVIVTEVAWETVVVVVGGVLLLPGNVQMGGTIGTLGHTGFVRPAIIGLTYHYTPSQSQL